MFQPTLVVEELYTQMFFFVQSILADRYINRRGLWMESLESPISVEYTNEKIFLNCVLSNIWRILAVFSAISVFLRTFFDKFAENISKLFTVVFLVLP